MARLIRAGRDYGWLLAITIALLAVLWVTYVVNPVKEAENNIGEPLAEAIGLVDGKCPDGWKATTRRDEHTRVEYCDRNNWRVHIHSDSTVSHGCPIVNNLCTDKFIFPTRRSDGKEILDVPGWPNDD